MAHHCSFSARVGFNIVLAPLNCMSLVYIIGVLAPLFFTITTIFNIVDIIFSKHIDGIAIYLLWCLIFFDVFNLNVIVVCFKTFIIIINGIFDLTIACFGLIMRSSLISVPVGFVDCAVNVFGMFSCSIILVDVLFSNQTLEHSP